MATKRRVPGAWRQPFLEQIALGNTISAACQAAGISRTNAYKERQKDETFALAWHDAEEAGTEVLEAEAKRRAVHGVEKGVWHQGEMVGTELQFSDTLLIFLLKGRRPEKYRDTARIEHSGSIDGKQTVKVEGGAFMSLNPADLTPEEQDMLAAALDRKAKGA